MLLWHRDRFCRHFHNTILYAFQLRFLASGISVLTQVSRFEQLLLVRSGSLRQTDASLSEHVVFVLTLWNVLVLDASQNMNEFKVPMIYDVPRVVCVLLVFLLFWLKCEQKRLLLCLSSEESNWTCWGYTQNTCFVVVVWRFSTVLYTTSWKNVSLMKTTLSKMHFWFKIFQLLKYLNQTLLTDL